MDCICTIQEAFGRYDEIHEKCAHVSKTNPRDDDNFFEGEKVIDERMKMLLKEVEAPLFEACGQSKISCLSNVLILLNACIVHQVTNTFQDELFRLLGCEILLKNNVMPKSRYEVRKLVSNPGLNYTSIHACEQRCILYHKKNKDLLVCPICKANGYVEGLESILCKVFRHFYVIPCLKRMYWCKIIAQLMQWHVKNTSEDGMFGLWLIQRHGNTLMQCGWILTKTLKTFVLL